MKRWILTAVLIIAALGCAGCGVPSPQQEEEPDKRLVTVGFSQIGSESSWRIANTESMKQAFSEENGFELIFDNAMQRQENQIKAIRTFIQQEVDYIVLAPIAETGWESVLAEAKSEGIPVVLVDRQVEVQDEELYATWVGPDFYNEAKMAVDWLQAELERTGRADKPVRILHLQGTEGASAQIGRSTGLEEAAAANENWTIIAQLPGEYTQAKAYEAALEYLTANSDIDVLYCENDDMAFGAMEAMDKLGVKYGRDGGVIVISFDSVRAALQACLEGKISLCVECNPLHGPRVARIIRQMEAGDMPPKRVYVTETCFSQENLTNAIIEQRAY